MPTEEEINAAKEEMEALYERGIRDATLTRGEQGNHAVDEDCWCCPRIERYYFGTLIIHRKKMYPATASAAARWTTVSGGRRS